MQNSSSNNYPLLHLHTSLNQIFRLVQHGWQQNLHAVSVSFTVSSLTYEVHTSFSIAITSSWRSPPFSVNSTSLPLSVQAGRDCQVVPGKHGPLRFQMILECHRKLTGMPPFVVAMKEGRYSLWRLRADDDDDATVNILSSVAVFIITVAFPFEFVLYWGAEILSKLTSASPQTNEQKTNSLLPAYSKQ